jgi:hypothetical protein
MRNGRLVEKGGPDDVRQAFQRSDLPCPMLISDQMPPCEHVDGRFYDSKAAYRAVTKANGLTEVGSEKLNQPRPKVPKAVREKGIDQAVERAIARVS